MSSAIMLGLFFHLPEDAVTDHSIASTESKVQETMNALGLPFEVMACDPELADTAVFCAHYGVPLEDSANTIIVASKKPKGQFAACVVLATTRLDVNRAVKKKMGVSRASFASAEQTMEVTGMMIGGVTPPGLPADLPLWVDARVMDRDAVIIGGGSRSSKLRIKPEVFLGLPNSEIVEGLARIPEG